ncbi:MAG: metal ABC transporter ATP-binding protein [Gammaproteobacteria bacterium]|nr:metal ABC transporter ATP-binding protein [Gammaproteobacteria bacterium]
MTSDMLIDARNIGVNLSNRWIFRHVDLAIERGKVVCVIGGNGAGKTTCVRTLLGLVNHSEGTIKRADPLSVGFVPQKLSITPILPVTIRRLAALAGKFKSGEIDEALSAVGLDELGNPSVSTLSGGEFQRLMLARAILRSPDLLVLDEPAQGVDVSGVEVLNKLILGVRDETNCGVLMISHDIELVFDIFDDVLVLIPHEFEKLRHSDTA